MNFTDDIVSSLNLHGADRKIQHIQTAHRVKLAEFWRIAADDRIL